MHADCHDAFNLSSNGSAKKHVHTYIHKLLIDKIYILPIFTHITCYIYNLETDMCSLCLSFSSSKFFNFSKQKAGRQMSCFLRTL